MKKKITILFGIQNQSMKFFWSWIGNTFKSDSSSWNDTELDDLRNLHQKFKKDYNQYTFFTLTK